MQISRGSKERFLLGGFYMFRLILEVSPLCVFFFYYRKWNQKYYRIFYGLFFLISFLLSFILTLCRKNIEDPQNFLRQVMCQKVWSERFFELKLKAYFRKIEVFTRFLDFLELYLLVSQQIKTALSNLQSCCSLH